MNTIMTIFYGLAALNCAFALVAMMLYKGIAQKRIWCLLPILWGFQLLLYFQVFGFHSLSGIAPTCGIAAIILACCQCLSLSKDASSRRPLFSGFWLFILGLASLVQESLPHDSFMLTYVFAMLFFLSRPVSLGFTLYSLSGMAHLFTGKDDARIYKTSKDSAFLGAIAFLGGEIVGCYWGFMGWGTTWRWSGNFLFSAMLFVLFMVAFHIPKGWFGSRQWRNIAFSAPLLCVALCIVLSKVIP